MSIPTRSLEVKYQWNGTLYGSDLIPRGFEDPVWWRNIKCSAVSATATKGIRKCRAQNRVNVGQSTANPPHTHCTRAFPIQGTADKRFVITVAAQNLICPQGRTYPINAEAITTINKITPMFHVSISRKELQYIPRPTCKYRHRKNQDAPLA